MASTSNPTVEAYTQKQDLQHEGLDETENAGSSSTSPHDANERVRSWETGNTVAAGHYLNTINDKLGWKPATMKVPWLASTAVCLLVWIGVLEYLSQISLRDGGVVFAASPDDFSKTATFLSNYLPTIVAITLSISWSWVDLDTQRLEPYFQMSKPGGASAADSILLHYPFEFVAVAPVKAFKRRYYTTSLCLMPLLMLIQSHWSVFISGTVTTIIFWGISPLQSAIFNTKTVEQTSPGSGNLQGRLSSITEHAVGLNLSFVPKAYDVVWLNQSLPPFTTPDAAYIPFSIDEDSNSISSKVIFSNRTLTSRTSMLSTSIQCASASVYNSSSLESYASKRSSSTTSYSFDGHFGCKVNMSASEIINSDDDYCLTYLGYETYFGESLQAKGCSANASNLYLAVMVSPKLEHITAEFCQTSYWIQDVSLTVAESDMAVVSSTPLAPLVKLSYADFNATSFQSIIWTGRLEGSMWRMIISNGDVIDFENQLDMSWRLSTLNIKLQGSFMAGFAAGFTRLSAEAYLERENLISSLEKAHRLLFALAMNGILTTVRNATAPAAITVTGSSYAISVVRPLAIVLEALLGWAVVSVLSLLFISARRSSCLTKDPASLTDVASMLESANDDSESFNISSVIIRNSNDVFFSLQHSRRWNLPERLSCRRINQPYQSSGRIVPNDIFSRPFYLGPITGLIFVVLLLGVIGALVTLKTLIDRHNGLSLPSKSGVATQIVLSYIPVIFSTFLEPYWVLLNRLLCLLQPFEELESCRAKAKNSLDLRYCSLPPPLALWRALRAKHHLLAAVCSISLLANVLTIGLGALLNPDVAFSETDSILKAKSKPLFNSTEPVKKSEESFYQDFFYVTESNLSANTSLPLWTSKEVYFSPTVLDINHPSVVTVKTYGFHVALSCDEVAVKNATYQPQSCIFSFNTTVIGSGGRSVECYFNQAGIAPSQDDDHDGPEGFETVAPLLASNPNASADEARTCSSALSVVYQRGNRRHSPDDPALFNATSSLYLVCQPALEISNYSVQLSQSGHVVSSIRQTQPSSNLSEYFAAPQKVSDLYINLNRLISWVRLQGQGYFSQTGSQVLVHNDAFGYDWFPYLVSELLRSRDTVNTSLPAPSAATVIPAVSALYSQLSATILSLSNDIFFPFSASEGATISATIQTSETRVFISDPMFYICITVLVLDVLVAIAYYWHRPQQILPYMPTTVASLICTFEGSSLAAAHGTWDAEWLFGFGKFTGTDGRLRVGIERQPFVQPLPNIR